VFNGGFSRGEGSVKIESDNIIPLGDYDFSIITRYPHLTTNVRGMEDLAKKFGIDHIDATELWWALLPFVDKRIFWYEMKFGSRVIFGNEKILSLIPIKSPKEIDLHEGISLMFNRLAGMLRWFDPEFLLTRPSKSKKERLVFEAIKGILACGDSLLILKRLYHYSYQHRLRTLRAIQKDHYLSTVSPGLVDDFEKATCFKLSPRFDEYHDPLEVWFVSRKHLLDTIIYYWQRYTRHKVKYLADFPYTFLRNSRPRFLDYMMYNHAMIKRLGSWKTALQINRSYADIARSTLFYLALSIERENINRRFLDYASSLIKTIIPAGKKLAGANNLAGKWRCVRDLADLAWSFSRK